MTLALWFELDEVSSERIGRAVSALSRRLQKPTFVPHVTIFGGLWIDRESAEDLLHELGSFSTATKVKLGEVSFDESWSRSIFLRVSPSEHMLEIHEQAGRRLGVSGPIFAPHLSLAYGEMTKDEKREAVDALQMVIPTEATIGSLSLWHTDPTGVAHWRPLRRIRLPKSSLARM